VPEQFVDPLIRPARGRTRAVVLVLHGGKADSREASRPWHLSAVRMTPFATSLHVQLARQGVAVWSVRYRFRGWNGSAASPVQDATRALELVRSTHGDVPVVLLGHSMGGRTALRLAQDPSVVGVVALAPWLPPGEPHRVKDRVVHLAHGSDDRWTDPRATRAWADKARATARDVVLTEVPRGGHFMLSRVALWNTLALGGVVAALTVALGTLDSDERGAVDPSAPAGGFE